MCLRTGSRLRGVVTTLVLQRGSCDYEVMEPAAEQDSLSWRGADGLDGVRRTKVPPVLCREVVEREQLVAILVEVIGRLRVLGLVLLVVIREPGKIAGRQARAR